VDSRHAEAAERLVKGLNRLRLEVGNPSLGRLAQLSGGQLSKSTLDDHLSHRRVRLPPWHLVAAYVTACRQAAVSTGLDTEHLGTLNDWYMLYVAALEGNTNVKSPINRDGTYKSSSARAEEGSEAIEELTVRLEPSAEPRSSRALRSRASHDAARDQDADFKTSRIGSFRHGPTLHNNDDELEISAQGSGKWTVHWRPPKPSTDKTKAGAPRDDRTTESLSSSHDLVPGDQGDLALSLEPGTALLLVKRGPYAGSQFLIDQDRTTIGRDPDADVFLDDATVSRTHSVIYRQDNSFKVRDIGSLNGTLLDRRRIAEEPLTSGDELQVGVFRFLFLQGY
jgi:Inner membrane component of T3SS, cytoplasmic domain